MTLARERDEMIDRRLPAVGIRDHRVLEAMRAVPRELFFPRGFEEEAYRDGDLPEWAATALSEPPALAQILQGLRIGAGDRVLEIGTGMGYGAAVLGEMAADVQSVEIRGALCATACARLARLGYGNIRVHHGDGAKGWPDQAPYDAIAVTASGRFVPPALLSQMAPGGRLVMPIGPPGRSQNLLRLTRVVRSGTTSYRPQSLGRGARFVPLEPAPGRATRRSL